MSGLQSTVAAAETAVERGFHSIATRLKAIGAHIAAALVHPRTPEPLREALPELMLVLEDIHQELAELRRPCPCDGAGQPLQFDMAQLDNPAVREQLIAIAQEVCQSLNQWHEQTASAPTPPSPPSDGASSTGNESTGG